MERNIKLIGLLNFFTDFVFFAPVAIIYFAKVTGSYALGMSIFSIAYVSSAFFEIPTGILSDRVGRKHTTVLGALCGICCVVLYAMGGSYITLALGALIQGLSRAFFSGNNDALLHDSLHAMDKEHQYHKHLGTTSSMFQIALAVSSVAGSVLAAVSFSLVMWISVIPQVCALFVALQLQEPPDRSSENTNLLKHIRIAVGLFIRNRKLRLLTLADTIDFSLGESGYFFRSAFVLTIWPLWAVGISNFLSNIGGALSFYFSGTIINKFSHRTVLFFDTIICRIINLFALVFPTVASPAIMSTTSLMFGVGTVAINSLQQHEFSADQRATMGSIVSLSQNLGFGIVSYLLGVLADYTGPKNTLIIVQVLLLLPLYLYPKIFKTQK